MLDLITKTYQEWSKDKAYIYAAAISFYALFAIAPIIIIVIATAGMIFGQTAISGEIVLLTENVIGHEIATVVESLIENAHLSEASLWMTVVSFFVFLFGASHLFSELKNMLNQIWDVNHRSPKKIRHIIRSRFISMLLVLCFGMLLTLSIIFSAVLSTVGVFLMNILPIKLYTISILYTGIVFVVVTLIFAAVYKILPDLKISWSDVWIGAIVTAILFMVGNYIIGIYMSYVNLGSVYGAAGSLIVMLFWLYYCAQIFFLGAEFTEVYAMEKGSYSHGFKKLTKLI
ncbi:YihY/virulence factor BrkB family protein [Patescibacteria group bacterium]|nr:YihY/virulence factor BrkB family protein [Patescibacteria group bacterium]